ncbi:MAG: alpha/beta hydrolase [Acidobacteria bacterium]|nr:alpha/beta hydrolase [Acidobacteriota bacterium]
MDESIRHLFDNRPIHVVQTLSGTYGVSATAWLSSQTRNGLETVLVEARLPPDLEVERTIEPPFGSTLIARHFVQGPADSRYTVRTELSQDGINVPYQFSEVGILGAKEEAEHFSKIVGDDAPVRWKMEVSNISGRIPHELPRGGERLQAEKGRSHVQREIRDYTVWFGTNRTPILRAGTVVDFGTNRSDVVRLGTCRVSIPKSHQLGSIGSSKWTRLRSGVDDRLVVWDVAVLAAEEYWHQLRSAVAGALEDERDAVVFLHGYRTTFRDAARRAAQLGVDLGISGVMAFYSWPSKGKVLGYGADVASVEASENSIADYLTRVARDSSAKKVHIIAHSMGNRALLRAVNRIASTAGTASGVRFSQIVIAAADVDTGLFENLSAAYALVSERTTMYVCPRDVALGLSRFLHQPRELASRRR